MCVCAIVVTGLTYWSNVKHGCYRVQQRQIPNTLNKRLQKRKLVVRYNYKTRNIKPPVKNDTCCQLIAVGRHCFLSDHVRLHHTRAYSGLLLGNITLRVIQTNMLPLSLRQLGYLSSTPACVIRSAIFFSRSSIRLPMSSSKDG